MSLTGTELRLSWEQPARQSQKVGQYVLFIDETWTVEQKTELKLRFCHTYSSVACPELATAHSSDRHPRL